MKVKIGDFVLDPSRNLVSGGGRETALEPKIVDVLLALANKPGEVISRDELIDAVWKTEFGADERVTRAISHLRKAFGDERGSARYIETVSKRGYRLVAPVERLEQATAEPPAQAELSEPTTDAPRASSTPVNGATVAGARRPSSRPAPPSLALMAAILGVAVVAGLGLMAWRWAALAVASDVVELRRLVLIDERPGMRTFAEQTHASLKRVLSSNGVMLVDRPVRDTQGVADSPRPEFALTGSLERIGDRFAVTLHLDNLVDGQTLRSMRFERVVGDAHDLQEEASVNIAFMIDCALKERRRARVKPSLETFKIYVESCDPSEVWANASRKRVVAQRLIAVAPRDPYGHGLEALATAFLASEDLKLSGSESEELKAVAHAAAQRAFALDPTSALARAAELLVQPQSEQWRKIDILRRASDYHISASGVYFAALRSSGRLVKALETARRAAAERVLLPYPRTWQGTIHMQLGEHDEAERIFERALRIWPDDANARFYRFINTAFYGDPATARGMLDLFSGRRRCYAAFIEMRGKVATRAQRATLRVACSPSDESHQDYLARMLAALGDVDGAYEVVKDRRFDWRGSTVFLFYPEMEAVRRDARFMPFIARSGLLEAWLATDQWPDFCHEEKLPYDCKAEARRALEARNAQR